MKRVKCHRVMNIMFLIVICIFLLACSKDEKNEEPSSEDSIPETSNVYLFATELNTNLINAGLSDDQAKVISNAAMLEAKPLIVEKISKNINLRSPKDENISQIAPAIVRGAMRSILDAELDDALTLTAIGVISGSPIQSLAGRVDTLNDEQKTSLIQSIVKTCTGLLGDAGVDSGNITKTALKILDAAYNALTVAGITETATMLEDMKTAVKEGLRDITTVDGFDSESAISSIDSYESAVATPTFSVAEGTYPETQTVTISTSTPDAVIRYTTNGTDPTCGTGTEYASTVSISSTTTLKAMACLTDWTDSSVASATFTITGTVATPAFSVAEGTYPETQTVTISTSTADAVIWFTTDGADPTCGAGTEYASAVSISSTSTLKAMACLNGWTDSSVASAIFTITGTVATPTLSVAEGTYLENQTVTISTSTADAAIWYTTDETDPTCGAGTEYASAVSISSTTTLKAMACLNDWTDSSVASAAYTLIPITVTAPNGAEDWPQDLAQTQTITWTFTGNITTVDIELWKGGNFDSTIATAVANDESYIWSIPNGCTTYPDSRIRIIDSSDPSVFDESDADFTLSPGIC